MSHDNLDVNGSLTVHQHASLLGNANVVGNLQVDGSSYSFGGMTIEGPLQVTERVGLGTVSPTKQLDVNGQACFRSARWEGPTEGVTGLIAGFDEANAGGTGFLFAHTKNRGSTRLWLDGAPIIFAPHARERMRLDGAGNLHLAGSLTITGGLINGQLAGLNVATNFTASIHCADLRIGGVPGRGPNRRAMVAWENELEINHNGDWSTTTIQNLANGSSKERKMNFQQLTLKKAKDEFMALQPSLFSMRTDPGQRVRAGFIAEDSSDLVTTHNSKAIFVDSIVAIVTKMAQHHHEEIARLKSRIAQLESFVEHGVSKDLQSGRMD